MTSQSLSDSQPAKTSYEVVFTISGSDHTSVADDIHSPGIGRMSTSTGSSAERLWRCGRAKDGSGVRTRMAGSNGIAGRCSRKMKTGIKLPELLC